MALENPDSWSGDWSALCNYKNKIYVLPVYTYIDWLQLS